MYESGFFFLLLNNIKLTANQNPSDFKELEHLTWQMTKLQRALIIKYRNVVIIIVICTNVNGTLDKPHCTFLSIII